ncbi:multicopper oxidase family protein, partial [Asanoa iriomotensis]
MKTHQLLAVDLALTVLIAALWVGAGVVAGGLVEGQRRRGMLAVSLAGAAVTATAARIVVVAVLAGRGWWFVQEKVVLALPLLLVAVLVAAPTAGPALVAAARCGAQPSPFARSALLTTGYAGAAGIASTLVVGYPARATAVASIATILAVLAVITWLVVGRRGRPAAVGALAVVCVLVAAAPVAAAASGGEETQRHGSVSVTSLRTPAGSSGAVRRFELTARQQKVVLPSGRVVRAWTFGSLPGPALTATQGDLVEVMLRNADIDAGVSLHWHGYDVPNGEDGVAGVTQDAIMPGQSFTYRFRAEDAGTYWYHSHQQSADAVRRGLFGTLVVSRAAGAGVDLTVPVHTIDGAVLVGASDRLEHTTVAAGTPVRLRLVNTDQTPHRFSLGGVAFRVVAMDGRDISAPTEVSGEVLRVPAGGRYDLAFTMPNQQVGLAVESAPSSGLALQPQGVSASGVAYADAPVFDPLGYGSPGELPTTFDRDYTLVLDRQMRFVNGGFRYAYTVNGRVFPEVPPLTVRAGDLIRITVVNRGVETHPMHPHGHHVLVLSRDGRPPTGSPLWLDT